MKSFLALVVTGILVSLLSSVWILAQSNEQNTSPTHPQIYQQLAMAIANADRSKTDNHSQLRLQRAEFYYQHALKYHAANWPAKARDYALRGLLLIELHQKALGKPGFYRPEIAKAQLAKLNAK